MNDEQLTQRLRSASEAMQMSESAQARHLEAISAGLGGLPADVIPLTRSDKRRRFVAAVAAATLIGPAGLAAASEGSLPGDALYPVKQISERVIAVFDSEVIARHRIEEIEALGNRSNPDLYDDARAALAELGEGHPLWERLAASTPPPMAAEPVEDDDDPSEATVAPATATLALPDGSEAVVTLVDGDLVEVVVPDGWSVFDVNDHGATLRSADFEVRVEVREDGSLEGLVTGAADDDSSESADDHDQDGVQSDDDSSAHTGGGSSSWDDGQDDHESGSDGGDSDESDGRRGDDDPSGDD